MVISFDKVGNVDRPPIVSSDATVDRVNYHKLLGVTISKNLTWNMHVSKIIYKAAKPVYLLYQLKRAGIAQCDLLRIYSNQSLGQYLSMPALYTCIPKYLSDDIENVQKRVMRSIFRESSYGITVNCVLKLRNAAK